MPRKLDIGIASYGAPDKLLRTLTAVRKTCSTDFRCLIIHNPHPDPAINQQTLDVAESCVAADPAFQIHKLSLNCGYAGAVNEFLELGNTEYLAYLDNDAVPLTEGWDEQLCKTLDKFHEIGMIFPNCGSYEIDRQNYREITWATGFCWVLTRNAQKQTGVFDVALGHQEEADYCLRLRMAGFKCAALPSVRVRHAATATNDPAASERINQGVIRWMNKWVKYFCGSSYDYYSPNVLRWDDWPPNALHLEEYWKEKLPGLNDSPQTFTDAERQYDFIRVPRVFGYYRGRVI